MTDQEWTAFEQGREDYITHHVEQATELTGKPLAAYLEGFKHESDKEHGA